MYKTISCATAIVNLFNIIKWALVKNSNLLKIMDLLFRIKLR